MLIMIHFIGRFQGIWYKTKVQPPHLTWFIRDIGRVPYLYLYRKNVVTHKLCSGHMPLRKFAYIMRKVSSPDCEVCDKPEEVLPCFDRMCLEPSWTIEGSN